MAEKDYCLLKEKTSSSDQDMQERCIGKEGEGHMAVHPNTHAHTRTHAHAHTHTHTHTHTHFISSYSIGLSQWNNDTRRAAYVHTHVL